MSTEGSKVYDLLIIGSGAAGFGAAIYAGRYLMKTLIVEGKKMGGETATAGIIHNYPGAKEVDGFELIQTMKSQAKDEGVEVTTGAVTRIVNENNCFTVNVGEKEYFAKTIIFAQGSERRRLGLPNEDKLTSKGVHYCVTCDGPLYGKKTVAVVGGGDASVKGVNLLAEYADKIYLIVRGDKMRAEPLNQEEMSKHGDKVEVLYNTEVKEILGEEKLEGVKLTTEVNGSDTLELDGLFIEIGSKPSVELATEIGVELDDLGYIKVNNMMETNVPGVYAAGDAVNHFGPFKQIVTAAALGSVASTTAYNYHKKHGNLCEIHWRPHEDKSIES